MVCEECRNCWNYMAYVSGCYGSDKTCENFVGGENECADSHKVQKALGMGFKECLSIFDFVRTAEWWSIAGKTEEERQRNGQRIATYFRKMPVNEII